MTDKLREAAEAALELLTGPLWGDGSYMDSDVYPDARELVTQLRAALTESDSDWSLLAETQASLREHMAEIHRLRAALAEPEVEPVAKVVLTETLGLPLLQWLDLDRQFNFSGGELLYAAPPRREWVSLTEQEIWDSVKHGVVGGIGMPSKAVAVARAIEAALKEKNQ